MIEPVIGLLGRTFVSEQKTSFRRKVDPSQPQFEISEWPFYHLVRVASLYSQRVDATLKPLGIDVPRWRVLAILKMHQRARITELAGEAVVKISTMAKIVQRMTAEGLVKVNQSPRDARATEVVMTAKGMEMLESLETKVIEIGQNAFGDIEDAELRQLNRLVVKMYENLCP